LKTTEDVEMTTKIRFDISCALGYQVNGPCDFLFNIEVAQTPQQRALASRHSVQNTESGGSVYVESFKAKDLPNRFIHFSASSGQVSVDYKASVSVEHCWAEPSTLHELAIAELPKETLPFLLPSRYCESDKLFHFANANFGHLPRGYQRIQAVSDWVYTNVKFSPGASNATTSATDTLSSRAGVCRDFAHLTIALLRSLNIPARFVAGYDYGADPALGPTDFHAYVEAYVGNRWFIFDSTQICPRNGLVRIGTGFDAADVAFATIFGPAQFTGMKLDIQPLDQNGEPITLVDDRSLAISTSANDDVRDEGMKSVAGRDRATEIAVGSTKRAPDFNTEWAMAKPAFDSARHIYQRAEAAGA
jgi:transglutaminase-like putative cysteine protease